MAAVVDESPSRDRSIDFLRLLSLLGVMLFHVLATVFGVDPRCAPQLCVLAYDTISSSDRMRRWTWAFQVMPVFFFAGAAANVGSWKTGASLGGWLLRRCQRLYRPTFWFLAFGLIVLGMFSLVLPAEAMAAANKQSLALLWFLGVYVLCLAWMPLFAEIRTGRQVAVVVVALLCATAFSDCARRVAGNGASALPNYLVVWLVPMVLGVGYRRGLIRLGVAATVSAMALLVDLSLVACGLYGVALVGVDPRFGSNMFPPSLLLAGHSVFLCCLAILVAPALRACAANRSVWRVLRAGNAGSMTLYLWHWIALALLFGLLNATGFLLPRGESYPGMSQKIWQLPVFAVIVFAVFRLCRGCETRALPWWDDPVDAKGWRSPVVAALLLVAGAATTVLSFTGPGGRGAWALGVMLLCLAAARAVAIARPARRSREADVEPLVRGGEHAP